MADVLVRCDSSSAASERFGCCLLAVDEDVSRPAPLTADEDVGQRSLVADEEAANKDVDRPART